MNKQSILNKLKEELKKETIDYYENLKYKIDLNAQSLMLNDDNLNEKDKKEILEENIFLIEQIDRVFNSNLNDLNQFFQNQNIAPINEDQSIINKEEIKKRAFKNYLVCIEHKNYPRFGIHFEFEWYIDENQLNFIKYTSLSEEIEYDYIMNQANILNRYAVEYKFNELISNHKYSYCKMPNYTDLLKSIKIFENQRHRDDEHFYQFFSMGLKCEIEKDAFCLFDQLKSLSNNIFNFDEYEIGKDSFNGLENLESLRLFNSNFTNTTIDNVISKMPKLKTLGLYEVSESKIYNYPYENLSFSEFNNLIKLEISLSKIKKHQFEGLINLKELCIIEPSRIKRNAFLGLQNLQKLVFKSVHIKILRKNRFNGLPNLSVLIFDKIFTLEKIKNNAFNGLSNLNELFFQSYDGSIEVGKDAFIGLTNLEHFFFKMDHLEIFDEYIFRHLNNIKSLDVQHLKLQSKINPFVDFDKLEKLIIDWPQFENYFFKMPQNKLLNKLTDLTISSNKDSNLDYIFDKIKSLNLMNLENLNILIYYRSYDDYEQKKIFSNNFIGFENLKMLTLNDKNSKIDPSYLNNLVNLVRLDLSGNNLSFNDKMNDIFSNLTNLTHLNLDSNREFKVNSSFFKPLKNLKELCLQNTSVKLKNNLFQHLSNLELLDMTNSNINIHDLNELTFFGLSNLKKLTLKNNREYEINGHEKLNANTFKYLINLIHLDLSVCAINIIDLNAFNGIYKLEILKLNQSNIEEMSEEHFKPLANLKQLDLYKNPFIYKKNIAQFYKNLNLKDLDLILDY